MKKLAAIVMTLGALISTPSIADDQWQATAEAAYIYAFPMIMAYGIMYDYNIDKNSSQYKGAFNQIVSEARFFTPRDTSVNTPNNDTPYSFVMMDLRAEPIVLCVPQVDDGRYYSVQLVSQYTFNFGYIGTRTTGNDAGCFAIAGPNWIGISPLGIKKLYRSETEFAMAIYRTQLFGPGDLQNVKQIQEGYLVLPLSQFLHQSPPPAAANIIWPKIDAHTAIENPFSYLNFILQFAPAIGDASVEQPLRDKFATIGIEAGKPYKVTGTQKKALQAAVQSGLSKIKNAVVSFGKNENNWLVTSSGFGDRAAMKGDFLTRAVAAMAGILGNDAAEALYPLARVDNQGQVLDASKYNYTITFPAGQLPPVKAFWSITMYDGKTHLLIDNPVNRYLINSQILPSLQKAKNGSLTIYVQNALPGIDKVSNWLPAPNGPFYLVMRLYWPKDAELQGKWQPPFVMRASAVVKN